MMRRLTILVYCAIAAGQTPPPFDSRNTDIPDTDTHFRPKAFWRHASHGTLEQWEQRKTHLRGQILSAAGLDPMPEKTPLNPRFLSKMERGDYSIENVLLETLPGYYLGGNLYRPAGRKGTFPGVLLAHGHARQGRIENTHLASPPSFGISMARQGYVVFSYDMVGWNDTKQTVHEFGGPRETLWAFGPLGLQLWNSTRVVDFLQSLPDVDAARIAMTGWSGGGTQTFLLTAVDDRIKVSAPVNMVSAVMQGGSPCENAPNLRIDTYNVEIAALAAPRPMLIVSSPWDQARNTPVDEYVVIRGIYSLYGKTHNVENVHVEAQHNYNRDSREAVYRFFGKHLLDATDPGQFQERPMTLEKPEDMLALHGSKLPENAKTYDQIFEYWRQHAARQSEQTRDLAELRRRLRYALAADAPGNILQDVKGEHVTLSRAGRRDRVAGVWRPGQGSPLLVMHPDGVGAARKSPAAAAALSAGRPVLIIDVFQTGSAAAVRDRSPRYFLTFNKSDDANRVQDIWTALAWLKKQSGERIELHGSGTAAIWGLFAAAVADLDLVLSGEIPRLPSSDLELEKLFFVPGIQRAGGIDSALRITAGLRKN